MRRLRVLRWLARADVALSIGLFLLALIELVPSEPESIRVLTAVLATLPVAIRRQAPLIAAVLIAASPLVYMTGGGPQEVSGTDSLADLLVHDRHADEHLVLAYRGSWSAWVSAVLVVYSLAAHTARWRALAGGVLLLASTWIATIAAAADLHLYVNLVRPGIPIALPWATGRVVRGYRHQALQLANASARLAQERDASARLAVAEERQRIARELHDVLAHTVTRMAVQAAGAEQWLRRAPHRARHALEAIQDAGREAIAELRQMLRLLRVDEEHPLPASEPALPEAPAIPHLSSPHVQARLAGAGCILRRYSYDTRTLTDIIFAVALVFAVDGIDIFVNYVLLGFDNGGDFHLPSPFIGAICGVTIAARRRAPLVSFALAAALIVAAAFGFGDSESGDLLLIILMLTVYSLAARAPARRATLGLTVTLLALATGAVLLGARLTDVLRVIALPFATVLCLGLAVRQYRRQAKQLRALNVRLARERDARARLAVVEERSRLARELHDSVAHAISVMVLQAGAAEQVLPTAPDRAYGALQAIEDQGRRAVQELHQLLGLLHTDEERSPRTPRPSLTQLDTLINRTRQAGQPVELTVHGERCDLPTGLNLAAYRIIQEGLTNAVKYARLAPTTVTLTYAPEALSIEIRDRGAVSPPPPREAGHGLLGMRERVALYGGQLEHGPQADGGYALCARLPLHQASA